MSLIVALFRAVYPWWFHGPEVDADGGRCDDLGSKPRLGE